MESSRTEQQDLIGIFTSNTIPLSPREGEGLGERGRREIHCEEERGSAALQSLALAGGGAEATAVYKDTYPQPQGCLHSVPQSLLRML